MVMPNRFQLIMSFSLAAYSKRLDLAVCRVARQGSHIPGFLRRGFLPTPAHPCEILPFDLTGDVTRRIFFSQHSSGVEPQRTQRQEYLPGIFDELGVSSGIERVLYAVPHRDPRPAEWLAGTSQSTPTPEA